MNSDRSLNACICIDEERISRRISVPRQIYFELDRHRIEEIETSIARQDSLRLSAQQLISLRYYSLINSPLAEIDRFTLVFTSNYSWDRQGLPTTVVRSTIDLTGKISQEIQQEFWRDRTSASRLIRVHYWLVGEILQQLPIQNKTSAFLTILFWCLRIIATLFLWYLLSLPFLIKLGSIVLLIFCLQRSMAISMRHYIKPWLLHHLIAGCLARSYKRRKWGFRLLIWLD